MVRSHVLRCSQAFSRIVYTESEIQVSSDLKIGCLRKKTYIGIHSITHNMDIMTKVDILPDLINDQETGSFVNH